MPANPNQHWGAENRKSVSRFVTRIVACSGLFVITLPSASG